MKKKFETLLLAFKAINKLKQSKNEFIIPKPIQTDIMNKAFSMTFIPLKNNTDLEQVCQVNKHESPLFIMIQDELLYYYSEKVDKPILILNHPEKVAEIKKICSTEKQKKLDLKECLVLESFMPCSIELLDTIPEKAILNLQSLKAFFPDYDIVFCKDREKKNNYIIQHKSQDIMRKLSDKLATTENLEIKGGTGKNKYVKDHLNQKKFGVVLTDLDVSKIEDFAYRAQRYCEGLSDFSALSRVGEDYKPEKVNNDSEQSNKNCQIF